MQATHWDFTSQLKHDISLSRTILQGVLMCSGPILKQGKQSYFILGRLYFTSEPYLAELKKHELNYCVKNKKQKNSQNCIFFQKRKSIFFTIAKENLLIWVIGPSAEIGTKLCKNIDIRRVIYRQSPVKTPDIKTLK